MRISRWMSRKLLRVLQYVLVGSILMLVAPLVLNWGKKTTGGDTAVRDAGHKQPEAAAVKDMPGAIIAPKDEPKEAPVGQVGVDLLPPLDTNGEVDPSAKYRNAQKKDWHDHAAMTRDSKRKGKGEQGAPVALPTDPETKKLQDQMYRVNGFDALASDQIAIDRSLKDIRHSSCINKKYLDKLPTTTVIFPFHNEHNSTLLRSVHSIINRSPPELMKEIVLVDDASTKDFLKAPLEKYLKDAHIDHIVKVVRCKKREGLIRARQIGAQHATQEVMVFLDSHSEANYNWLPPLLEPIALNWKTVVCPLVDVVDCDTFELRPQDEGARGSFDWEFNYKRLMLTDEDNKHPGEPFPSPIMAGGYFAINRKWFWTLGGYDEGLDIWGGEQYELSFKVWQCHGRMVDTPCSRVGHIYRCKYVPFPNPGVGDFISRNYRRVAEVWMDEYQHHLYKRRPALKEIDPGDLTKQKAVRERLKCKSFKWFMEEVAFDQDKYYPAIEPPDGANGELRSVAAPDKCLDTQFKGKEERFGLRKCLKDDASVGGEQTMRLSFWQDIRPKDRSMCLDVSTSVNKAPVILFPCHGMKGNQHWKYGEKSQQLLHANSMCLDCDPERGELFMSPCNANSQSQRWKFENINSKVLKEWRDKEAAKGGKVAL